MAGDELTGGDITSGVQRSAEGRILPLSASPSRYALVPGCHSAVGSGRLPLSLLN